MRIVITGASGFIGRRLVPRLAREHGLVAVTRGTRLDGCESIAADLAAADPTRGWPDRVDAVVHLAQSPRHREFPDGAADMTAVNVTATAALLEYARRAGASTFVLASTGNVYTPGPEPAREDDPIAPASFYAATKAAAESLARAYGGTMRVCLLRLFYPYGPGQENRLVPSLVDRVRSGRPIALAGSGDGLVLTPTYVDDIADVMAAALEDDRLAGTLNVSAPEAVTLRALGERIGRTLGLEPRFEQGGGSEPPCLLPSLERLARVYALSRFTTVDDGLARTLAHQAVA